MGIWYDINSGLDYLFNVSISSAEGVSIGWDYKEEEERDVYY